MQGYPQPERYVGRPLERLEDAALLTGRGRYADDLPVRADTLHGAILRSPHAQAEIVSIDASEALAQPGVVAVLTGADIKEFTDPFIMVLKLPLDQWSLAVDRVRFDGEAVALVVAEDRYRAEDALEYIRVEYKPLPAVVDPREAAKEGAPLVHPAAGTNVVSVREFKYGDPDKAFAEADRRVELTIEFPRNSQTPMEGYVVVAEYLPEDGTYDVLANFQGPYTVHPVMARALRASSSALRLRTPRDSGGGFGVKQAIFPYVVLMSAASKVVGRPVKWVEDRLEHLSAATAAPNRVIHLEAAVTKDGKVTAFRFDQLDDYGAYLRAPMPGPLYRPHGCLTGPYDIPNLAATNRLVMTNKTPSGMVRGFGCPQMYFAIERVMQRVAVELGLDPLDVIRRNLIPAGSFPYRTAAGALFDSGDYPKAVEIAIEDGGLEELKERREKARAEGRLYGIGYCAIVEPGQSNMGYLSTILPAEERRRTPKGGAVSQVTVNVEPLGGVSVTADCMPQGQGQATVLAQIVADELGLRPDQIKVNLEHDTQKDAWSIASGNYSSRFASATAVAAQRAAQKVRAKLACIAVQTLNVPQDKVSFAEGRIFAADNPDNAMPFHRVAGSAHWQPGSLPADVEAGVRETGVWAPPELESPTETDHINTSLTYGFVFDYCGVEIDPDTCEARIDTYVTMHDAGKLLNPLVVKGQIEGSFGWGVGIALYEEFAYADDGSFLSGTFAEYLCPTAAEVPEPIMLYMETPSPFTPLGAKGLGEGNCITTPVCIANAVADALGVRDVTLPLSPAKISPLIHGEEPAAPTGRVAPEATPAAGGRALSGEGASLVPAAPEEVWRALLDPEKLAAVIPGCRRLDRVGDNDYRAEVTLGAGPVRGRFRASVRLSELEPPHAATLSGTLAGPLGSCRGSGRVRLEAKDGATHVTYDYTVEIGGKVAAVGGRMLNGAARLLVRQFFERLTAQVGGRPVVEPRWRRLLRFLGIGR